MSRGATLAQPRFNPGAIQAPATRKCKKSGGVTSLMEVGDLSSVPCSTLV